MRNVPEDVHRVLKTKAALTGQSLSDRVLDDLGRLARMPSEEELLGTYPRQDPVGETARPAQPPPYTDRETQ